MKNKQLNGYELFKQQGTQLKQKKVKKSGKITPVNSIQEVIIQEKTVKTEFNIIKAISTGDYVDVLKARRVIDNSKYMVNNQLVLPREITNLIDNKAYLPRHMKLARLYGVEWLLKVAEIARTKNIPSQWYAKVTAKKINPKTGVSYWSQTEEMLTKLFKRIEVVKEKLQGIGVDDQWLNYYVGAYRQLTDDQFTRCLKKARSKWSKNPANTLAKEIKKRLDRLPAQATA